MSETQSCAHSLNWYNWDAKLNVNTNITETPRPDLAPIWLRHPIFHEYIYGWDAVYLWHTYDWDTLTRSCTCIWLRRKCSYMTALQMPNIICLSIFLIQIFGELYLEWKTREQTERKSPKLKRKTSKSNKCFLMWNSVTFGNNEA